MIVATAKRLEHEIQTLRKDVAMLKAAVLARDPEGEYRASFVKKMLAQSQSRGPFHRFTTRRAFLKHVRSKV